MTVMPSASQVAIAEINAKREPGSVRVRAPRRAKSLPGTAGKSATLSSRFGRDREAVIGKGQGNWSLMMHEQEVYRDARGDWRVGRIAKHLRGPYGPFRMAYMMTDKPNLDPNVGMGINAEQLERMQ